MHANSKRPTERASQRANFRSIVQKRPYEKVEHDYNNKTYIAIAKDGLVSWQYPIYYTTIKSIFMESD
jgi:hypothetical protein